MEDQTLINGLQAKRTELQREIVDLRERAGVISNDIDALDRVLESLGVRGEINGKTPKQSRIILFHRCELKPFVAAELKKSGRPMSPRELACIVCQCEGKDARDYRLIRDVTSRVSDALRKLKAARLVESAKSESGNGHVWRWA